MTTQTDAQKQASDAYFSRRISADQYNRIMRGTLSLNEALQGSQSGGGPLAGGPGGAIDSGDLLTRGATNDRRAPDPSGIDSGNFLTEGAYRPSSGGPGSPQGAAGNPPGADPAVGPQDPFTGAITDIDAYLDELSGTPSARRGLFQENLGGSPQYLNAPRQVQSFLSGRFDPLNALYVGQSAADPSRPGEDFASFLGANQRSPTGENWRDLWGSINQNYGGVGSAEDLAALGRTPGVGGALEAGYTSLMNQGRNVFGQAVRSNVHPALSRAVDSVLNQRWNQWSGPTQGSPSNQMAFLQEQNPLWQSVLNPQGQQIGQLPPAVATKRRRRTARR